MEINNIYFAKYSAVVGRGSCAPDVWDRASMEFCPINMFQGMGVETNIRKGIAPSFAEPPILVGSWVDNVRLHSTVGTTSSSCID